MDRDRAAARPRNAGTEAVDAPHHTDSCSSSSSPPPGQFYESSPNHPSNRTQGPPGHVSPGASPTGTKESIYSSGSETYSEYTAPYKPVVVEHSRSHVDLPDLGADPDSVGS